MSDASASEVECFLSAGEFEHIIDSAALVADGYDVDCADPHRKRWILDQMIRVLTGGGYEEWIRNYDEHADQFIRDLGRRPHGRHVTTVKSLGVQTRAYGLNGWDDDPDRTREDVLRALYDAWTRARARSLR